MESKESLLAMLDSAIHGSKIKSVNALGKILNVDAKRLKEIAKGDFRKISKDEIITYVARLIIGKNKYGPKKENKRD